MEGNHLTQDYLATSILFTLLFPYCHFTLTCCVADLNFLTLTHSLSSARTQEPQKQDYLSGISLGVVLIQSLPDGSTELLASFQDYAERPARSRVPHLFSSSLCP